MKEKALRYFVYYGKLTVLFLMILSFLFFQSMHPV